MPLLPRSLPAAKLITALSIQALHCLCRALRINAVPLLNQTVPSLSATLPNSPVPSHLDAIPHFALAALGFAVQSLTLPWPCGALPFVTLLLPFASSPSRSGLCCFGAVQRFGCSVRHHYQPQQCSAPANPFTSRPLHSNPDPCIAPAAPLSSSPGQRYGYQRHTLPRLTSPAPCCTVASLLVAYH